MIGKTLICIRLPPNRMTQAGTRPSQRPVSIKRRNCKIAPPEYFFMQLTRQTARLCQYPWLIDQIDNLQVSPFGPTTVGSRDDKVALG